MKNTNNTSRPGFNEKASTKDALTYSAAQVKAGMYALSIEYDDEHATDASYLQHTEARRVMSSLFKKRVKSEMSLHDIKDLVRGKMPDGKVDAFANNIITNINNMNPTLVKTYSTLFNNAENMLKHKKLINKDPRNTKNPYTSEYKPS
jgi:hypothetical protein